MNDMVSTDSDDEGNMTHMWSDYLEERPNGVKKTKQELAEEAYFKKRCKDVMTSMYVSQNFQLRKQL